MYRGLRNRGKGELSLLAIPLSLMGGFPCGFVCARSEGAGGRAALMKTDGGDKVTSASLLDPTAQEAAVEA